MKRKKIHNKLMAIYSATIVFGCIFFALSAAAFLGCYTGSSNGRPLLSFIGLAASWVTIFFGTELFTVEDQKYNDDSK